MMEEIVVEKEIESPKEMEGSTEETNEDKVEKMIIENQAENSEQVSEVSKTTEDKEKDEKGIEEQETEVVVPSIPPLILDWDQVKDTKLIGITQSQNQKSNLKSEDNYFRCASWSPDGLCFYGYARDNILRLYNLPSSAYGDQDQPEELKPVLEMKERTPIYDSCWYPLMSSHNPETCLIAVSSFGNPVRLWDAYTGLTRTSFVPISHMGEAISPHSLCFTPNGKFIYCGFRKFIQIFNLDNPGINIQRRPRLGKKSDLGGIISSIDIAADQKQYAMGSYNGYVGLFTEPRGDCHQILQTDSNGVTKVKFGHSDGYVKYLAAGCRKDSRVMIWDTRKLRAPLVEFRRRVENHQKFHFEFTNDGEHIITSGQTGVVSVYSLKNLSEMEESKPIFEWKAHKDSCSYATLNPYTNLMVTCSGQKRLHKPKWLMKRKYEDTAESSDSSGFDEDTFESLSEDEAKKKPLPGPMGKIFDDHLKLKGKLTKQTIENTLKVWKVNLIM